MSCLTLWNLWRGYSLCICFHNLIFLFRAGAWGSNPINTSLFFKFRNSIINKSSLKLAIIKKILNQKLNSKNALRVHLIKFLQNSPSRFFRVVYMRIGKNKWDRKKIVYEIKEFLGRFMFCLECISITPWI